MSDDAASPLDHLAQQYVQRLRAGEAISPEAYAEAHPAWAERIRELFPVLALMEGLKPPAAASAPAHAAEPAAPHAAEATGPRQVGPYAIVRELGRGGMGRVYEVRDDQGRRCALKVVHPHLLERSGFLARFLREIEAGRRIDHAGVVRALDSGVAEVDGVEVPYVLLEYVEGETLRDLLEDTGAVSERLAREIGRATAEALAAVHAAGIVHRDVKPENVILAPDETVKLMDLGVALLQEEALRITQTGEFVGSLLYAAPEQLRQGHVDARADLYALGLVLYELVAGRHPEAAGSGPLLAQKFATRRVRPLREVVPTATPFFERVLGGLLAPQVAQRLDSAAAVARILAEGEEGAWWQEARLRAGASARPRRFLGGVGFVGRETEQGALDDAWMQAQTGAGQVRVLRGEAGIGKSRLLSTWLDRVEAREVGVVTLWIEHTLGADVPGLAPLARALRDRLGEEPQERLRAWLGDRADRAAQVLSGLEQAGRAEGPPALGYAALETMILQLLRGLAREQPLIVVVEDLHFATEEGRALFARLAAAMGEDPVLLLGTSRRAEEDAATGALDHLPHASYLDLGALDETSALALLREGLGAEPHAADAVRGLVRISDGNPYCLLEFARDLRARVQRGGSAAADVALPRSVRKLVEARLQALDREDRDLLAVAACCGYRFDPLVVCEAADLPRIGGLRALHRLERERGLIVADGAEYRFHHHLVQEALHDELPPALRASYHEALGAACEARLPRDVEPSGAAAFAIARHYLLGERAARSRPYVVAGLDYLLSLAEGGRAARMARAALEGLPDASTDLTARLRYHLARAMDGRAPPTEIVAVVQEALAAARATDDRALELDVLQHLGAAVSHTGRHAEAAGISAQSVELAETVGDPVRLARALTSHATSLYNLGDQEAAFAAGRRALDLAREAGAGTQAGQTATVLSAIYLEAGRMDDARPLAEMALSATHLHGDRGAEQFVSGVLAKMTHMQGDVAGAETLIARSQALAREMGNLRVATGADIGRTQVLLNLARPQEALEISQQALAVCERMGYVEIALLVAIPRMLAATAVGDFAAACATAERSLAQLEQVPLPAIVARVLSAVAHVQAWTGHLEAAQATIARGLAAAEEARVPRERLQLQQAAAGLEDARGRPAEAAALYARTLEAVRALGWDLYVAFVACRQGGLLVRLGREDEARRALDAALDVAEGGSLPAVAAECGIWLDLLAGGNLQRARIALERDAHLLTATARLRLARELAARSAEAQDRDRADVLRTTLLGRAPAETRARMRHDLELYGDAEV